MKVLFYGGQMHGRVIDVRDGATQIEFLAQREKQTPPPVYLVDTLVLGGARYRVAFPALLERPEPMALAWLAETVGYEPEVPPLDAALLPGTPL